MAFENYRYETDSGQIVRVRLSTDKAAYAGPEATGTLTDNRLRVAAAGSTRQSTRLIARCLIYTFSEPTPGGLKAIKTVRFPILTKATFAAAPPATVEYKGRTYRFSNANAED